MKHYVRIALEKIIYFFKVHVSKKHDEFPYYLLIFISFIVFIACINIFVELTEELSSKALLNFDNQLTAFISSFRDPDYHGLIKFITDIGDLYGYLISTILATTFLFWKLKNWKFIIQLVGVIILASLSNIGLKKAIDRARPDAEHLVVVESLSYPSGHAMSAMAFYGFIIYLLFQIKMSRFLRGFLVVFFVLVILGIGLSRIYLGVHYPSDVIAGYLGGFIWVTFCIVLFNLIDLLRRRRNSNEREENLEN
ncbi:MAG TPA: phosphatase PAP2 family protein [Salegentibacter sp.]|uniref:phosphatase PAP2 family protein n=1 Tax=Salegentibacter sp. TaxID=1903072 RepID=UPI002F950655